MFVNCVINLPFEINLSGIGNSDGSGGAVAGSAGHHGFLFAGNR